jgi:hypothetical protein
MLLLAIDNSNYKIGTIMTKYESNNLTVETYKNIDTCGKILSGN